MYLIDTNIISEARKGRIANAGVRAFFADANANGTPVFLSVITVGELRRGVELIRHRGDMLQARRLENWLGSIVANFSSRILDVDADVAQLWGRLCVPHGENAIDKLIAATALIHDLTVVTRNRRHFVATGVPVLDPFASST
ncbi:type II toxin-antitoxin system VapC family toxin [Rudaea sp.]|uniref:type II toxin-antitoxin system VapC family toxin n=1 Tax=Rudaea sp. TaxID=2136325 RepID=UPI0032201816